MKVARLNEYKSSKSSKSNLTEFLGPVENLESYVKADWWRHLFNANYLRTDGDIVEDNMGDERLYATVVSTPFYDPEGKRINYNGSLPDKPYKMELGHHPAFFPGHAGFCP
jgi:hypothetical protein